MCAAQRSKYLPPMPALNAIPTLHMLLFASADTSPAQRVPCLKITHSTIIDQATQTTQNKALVTNRELTKNTKK